MNVIDLFCGCGGFSKGFEQAGFDVRLGIDIWQDAVTTYKANFPSAATIVGDISTLTGDDLLAAAGMSANEVDVIIGGPPCQGFSLSGKRMLDDPRNILYKSFVRMVETIQPKAFVMENVPGLVRLFNGQVKEFDKAECSKCPLKDQCLYKSKNGKLLHKGRRLEVPLRYDAVLRDLKRNDTQEFEEASNKRFKVERRFATMVRNHGLRRCRYLRLKGAKIHIILANMVCNIVRMINLICPPSTAMPEM